MKVKTRRICRDLLKASLHRQADLVMASAMADGLSVRQLELKLQCAETALVQIRCCVVLPVANTREIHNLLSLSLEFGVLGCLRIFRVQNSQPTGK